MFAREAFLTPVKQLHYKRSSSPAGEFGASNFFVEEFAGIASTPDFLDGMNKWRAEFVAY